MPGHLFHLFARSLLTIPGVLGSTWAGIVFPIIVILIGEVIGASLFGWNAMLENWRKATGVGFAALGVGYALLFLWCAMLTTYTDHEGLVARNRELQSQQINNPYEKSFIGSYAYTNTLQAFGYLVRDPRHQPDLHSQCQIKITADPENYAIAASLIGIASAMGCYVFQGSYNPDIDPEALSEINQSLPDFLVIHAVKDNIRSDGFVVAMSNTFHVRRTYELPANSPSNLLWIQIGKGSVWRRQ
jgi:hypothetical protein